MNIKELLDNYQSNKFHIERRKQIRLRTLHITDDDYPSCVQALTGMPKGNNISDSTYNTIAKKETDIEKLDKMIEDLEQEVKVVDSLISTLKYDDHHIPLFCF